MTSSVKAFFASPDSPVEDDDEELRGRPAFPAVEHDSADEESEAVFAYLSSVSRQSREGPLAVVADLCADKITTTGGSFSVETRGERVSSESLVRSSSELGKKIEIFRCLREKLNVTRSFSRSMRIRFQESELNTETLNSLDEASVVEAVERLPRENIVYWEKWVFGLLAVLRHPLFDDTSDALQKIKKNCERSEMGDLIAAIISEVFNQK